MFQRVIVPLDGSPEVACAQALAERLRGPGGAILTAPPDGLAELAGLEEADLIALPSALTAPLGRLRLGPESQRVLEQASCAVAAAPAGLRDTRPFSHVGVAFDDSPEARNALAAAYAVAAAHGSEATLLLSDDAFPVAATGDLARARAEARLTAEKMLDRAAGSAPAGVTPRTMLLHGAPGPLIRQACNDAVDLLICGARSFGPFQQRELLGRVAKRLIEDAPQPVLVLPRAGAGPQLSDQPLVAALGGASSARQRSRRSV